MILDKYLKKLGVSSYLDLNDEERATYKEWEKALAGRKITDEDVALFLSREKDQAVSRLTETNLSIEDTAFRKAEVQFITKLQAFLNSPRVEREIVEAQLSSQL